MRGGRLRPVLAGVLCWLLVGCTGDPSPGPPPEEAPGSTAARTGSGPPLRYVALGDSFTAAPGVADTDRSDSCLRSTRNYPALVAERLAEHHTVTLVDRSCTGAETTDLQDGQVFGSDTLPPQLDALTAGTDLVTLSVGGNDFGVFLRLLQGCLTVRQEDAGRSPCRAAAEQQGNRLAGLLPQIQRRLVAAVRAIERRAPGAEVLVVGYPQLAPAVGGCPQLLPLARGDVGFAHEVNRALTDTLARAAERTGTTYVDVWSASAGHDICAEEPWTNGLQARSGGAIPFHPLPAGQAAVADLVVAAVEQG